MDTKRCTVPVVSTAAAAIPAAPAGFTDFVRSCQTPVLVMPDDSPPHPYAVAMESVMLAPKSAVTMFPWKDSKEKIPFAIRQVRSFLRAHCPAAA